MKVLQDLLEPERSEASWGQLDCNRHSVKVQADRRHFSRVPVRHREVGLAAARPDCKQPYQLGFSQV